MNENILKALIQLFALVSDIDVAVKQPDHERKFVESFLSSLLSKDLINKYLIQFDDYLKIYSSKQVGIPARKKRKREMVDAMKVMAICEQINKELEQKQKTFVLLKLLEFISLDETLTEKELDFVLSVATAFNIEETEYLNCKHFVFNTLDELPEKQNIRIFDGSNGKPNDEIKHINIGSLSGEILFLHIKSTHTFAFRYTGDQDIFLNGQNIIPKQIYIFETGSSLRSATTKTVYYTDVVKEFMNLPKEKSASLIARDIFFRFRNSENGVRLQELNIDSGQLVGIMGASGAGKSTLLNILNGNIKPQQGQVFIDGHDVYDSKDIAKNSIVGYVPQDDILFEELTVFQNLYFNAQLCLNNYSEDKRKETVDKMLLSLDLYGIKDLVVGNLLNKLISGGQRKRLNIALELIREPSVLFVDEPTSGLSSIDSEAVMNLLKEQTLKGKIVIVNIHQPSSDIFKMFDRMLFLDKGGYLIYSGNPIDAISYFKSKSNFINAKVEQCGECGNVNPEQLLQIIESRIVNEYGKLTRTRKITPKEWYDVFHQSHKQTSIPVRQKNKSTQGMFSIPTKLAQFKIFLHRDVLTKLSNKQYLLISLLEAPILAILLGFFTKYISGNGGNPDAYVFMENNNIPAYIFMAVVVALFLGLSLSAEEIIKDRKHLKRESFLGLSQKSYLHSKIGLLFFMSAIQMLSFVLIANYILEIKGMTFHYWLMLFSTSCLANLLGLNLSSALNSAITIYILIPFILVPQLLFSGVIVRYQELHKSITSQVYVPLIGDLMTSRWAYEALVVHQHNANEFQKHFADMEQEKSSASYYKDYLIPELLLSLRYCSEKLKNADRAGDFDLNIDLINNGIKKLTLNTGLSFTHLAKLNKAELSIEVLNDTKAYLKRAKQELMNRRNDAAKRKDIKYHQLVSALGGEDAFYLFRQQYHNKRLDELVTNKEGVEKIIRVGEQFVQLKDPIYKSPDSNCGRAHFYSSYKRLGNWQIPTYWFNLMFIWLSSLVLYLALIAKVLNKLINGKRK
ncbi:ABC-type multidrug transport system, ATPase component [Saccharicrinis carchari]|uniref:ABC-type multidrug transport system, ATPase component n=1 Tax=Saccharicrinis carchari TaxID=1168039 RepID=A0A521AT95_SACCC|nr:ATP-binding cassette domain-containing protein [Saccharicrinis carchari]SMO38043.1 ABC-type multidrug transport system, ATPase component [Saccharicrinis carchari]